MTDARHIRLVEVPHQQPKRDWRGIRKALRREAVHLDKLCTQVANDRPEHAEIADAIRWRVMVLEELASEICAMEVDG